MAKYAQYNANGSTQTRGRDPGTHKSFRKTRYGGNMEISKRWREETAMLIAPLKKEDRAPTQNDTDVMERWTQSLKQNPHVIGGEKDRKQ